MRPSQNSCVSWDAVPQLLPEKQCAGNTARREGDLPIIGAPVTLGVLVLSVEHNRDDCYHGLQENKLQSTALAHAHEGAVDWQRWHAAGAVEPGRVHHKAIHLHLLPAPPSALSTAHL
jgi:hypothetical protein